MRADDIQPGTFMSIACCSCWLVALGPDPTDPTMSRFMIARYCQEPHCGLGANTILRIVSGQDVDELGPYRLRHRTVFEA